MGPMSGKPNRVKDEGRILLIGLDGAGRVIVLRDKTYVPVLYCSNKIWVQVRVRMN